MKKLLISSMLLGSMALAAQSTEAGRVPLYSSGFMTLPYGAAPGMGDGVSLLYFGPNAQVFSVGQSDEETQLSLSSMPNLGGDNGPESLVTRIGLAHQWKENTALVGGFSYFQSGSVELRDGQGNELGIFTPSETALRLGVVQRFSDDFKGGVRLGYLSTNLGSSVSNARIVETALTADFSLDYSVDLKQGELIAYWALNNVGRKNTFSESNLNYLPTQMQMGSGLKTDLSDNISFAPSLSLYKYLVPTPPVLDANGAVISGQAQSTSFFGSMFGSFGDAPGGFAEELAEWRVQLGGEMLINESFYIGTSLSWESTEKGNRQLLSLGVGYAAESFGAGIGYYLPLSKEAVYYEGVVGLNLVVNL